MMFAQTARLQSVSSFVTILLFLGSGACLCKAQEPALGELKLEGKYIERLVLSRNDGHREVFSDPKETVKLPVGQYLLQDVRLKGGYARRGISDRNRVTISEEKMAVLRVGAPLKQTVSVRRRGRMLELSYGLYGVGGATYTAVRNANKRPTFTIYKGDRKIATGEFEFG